MLISVWGRDLGLVVNDEIYEVRVDDVDFSVEVSGASSTLKGRGIDRILRCGRM